MWPLQPQLEHIGCVFFFLDLSKENLFLVLAINVILSMEGEDPMDLCLSSWMIRENTLFISGKGSISKICARNWE